MRTTGRPRVLRIAPAVLWMCSCVLPSFAADAVEVRQAGDTIAVQIGERPFTTYYFGPSVTKPYLMPLTAADGTVVTRSFPIGNDVGNANPRTPAFEPHQRPLYFGHGDVDGLDFWQEEAFDKYYRDHGKQSYGRVQLKEVEQASGAADHGSIRATFNMLDPSGRVIAQETQTFTFRGDQRTRMVDCDFTVHATNGPVTFGDTKEGTFAVRLAPELSGSRVHMVSSNGAEGEKAIWGKPADWIDYYGTIDGKDVGVAILDSPASFRHPTTWHARAYGLFAANPFGWREFSRDENRDGSWTVPEGKSLSFRYRVIIHFGDYRSAAIADAYREYAAEAKP